MKNKMLKNLTIVFALIVLMVMLIPLVFGNLKFGLDLQGGFEVLYQIDSIDGSEVTDDMVLNVTYKDQTIEVFNQNKNPVFKL